MKTVVVISDTHRNVAPLSQISQVLSECDIIVHLGDMASDARELMRTYPEKTYVLAGNNDFFGGADEVVIDVEGTPYICLSRAQIRRKKRYGKTCRSGENQTVRHCALRSYARG